MQTRRLYWWISYRRINRTEICRRHRLICSTYLGSLITRQTYSTKNWKAKLSKTRVRVRRQTYNTKNWKAKLSKAHGIMKYL